VAVGTVQEPVVKLHCCLFPLCAAFFDLWPAAAAAADLYNCGKVCLSLLGTWNGGQGEGWNPDVSSAFQVHQTGSMFPFRL
jgi:hypothetical protein